MTFDTPEGLRMALEQRLNNQADSTGIGIDRLRRRVIFERVVSRLAHAEPGQWVLKGGMALEVRLQDRARLTKDIDLGLRDTIEGGTGLQERIVEALSVDPFGDRFIFAASPATVLGVDGGNEQTWRSSVTAQLAGRPFGSIRLDVSPRPYELERTDDIALPNSLAFAGIDATVIEIVDVNRHAAEKFHGMLREFGDRENSRVRDLLDLVILVESDVLKTPAVSTSVREVWKERDATEPPAALPGLPTTWPTRYESLAADYDVAAKLFPEAVETVTTLWVNLNLEES